MKYEVDEQKCSGHGQCYTFSASVFSDDDVGFNADRGLSPQPLAEQLEEDARRGARLCPEGAITIIEN